MMETRCTAGGAAVIKGSNPMDSGGEGTEEWKTSDSEEENTDEDSDFEVKAPKRRTKPNKVVVRKSQNKSNTIPKEIEQPCSEEGIVEESDQSESGTESTEEWKPSDSEAENAAEGEQINSREENVEKMEELNSDEEIAKECLLSRFAPLHASCKRGRPLPRKIRPRGQVRKSKAYGHTDFEVPVPRRMCTRRQARINKINRNTVIEGRRSLEIAKDCQIPTTVSATQQVVSRRGRPRKKKPQDKFKDSVVSIPRSPENSNRPTRRRAKKSGRNQDATTDEGEQSESSNDTAYEHPNPGRPTKRSCTSQRGHPLKSKTTDGQNDFIIVQHVHFHFHGQSEERQERKSRKGNSKTPKKRAQLDSEEKISSESPNILTTPRRSLRKTRCKDSARGQKIARKEIIKSITLEQGELDSDAFLHYLMSIWSSFSVEKLRLFTYIEPLWFDAYVRGTNNVAVIDWIKAKDVFAKKYVFVPIVLCGYWNLLIFCHLGKSVKSKTDTPCMLLLNSWCPEGDNQQLEPEIKRLLCDIYGSDERHETREQLEKMPILFPQVPQQKNGTERGYYVLYCIKRFMESAPKNFSLFNGYPYFMNENWFSAEDVETFCQWLNDRTAVQ